MSENKVYYSYNQIHRIIQNNIPKIKKFNIDAIITIAGGGCVPGRIIRTFLKVPMYVIIIELYDENNKPREKPKIIQWLSEEQLEKLKGKNILVVDEVDDTRMTLKYTTDLLLKYEFNSVAVFVVNNKKKAKCGELDTRINYLAGQEIDDVWVNYPWESHDIDQHQMKVLTLDWMKINNKN